MHPFVSSLVELVRKATHISLILFRIMIPVILIVKILKELGLVEVLGNVLAPAMELAGLPGSAGLVWASTMVTNIYGGMVVFVSLYGDHPLTVAQATVLTSMMLIAHSLPIELRIVQKAGVRLYVMALLRIGGAFLYGFCLNEGYRLGGWLQTPNNIRWIPSAHDPSLLAWGIAQVKSLAMVYLAILTLLGFMRFLDRIGVTDIMTRALHPVLHFLGIGKAASTITIVGIVLGLAYGGGLIIEEARSGRIDRRDILFSLCLMGLCHSLFEDSLLMVALGGHLSGILWGRALFAMVCIFFMVKWISRISETAFRKYLVWDVPPIQGNAMEAAE